MKRRDFLKRIAAAGTATALIPTLRCSRKAPSKPNIIFIMADDLGYNEVGCYGQDKIETPNIDALAKKGMKFTQFYSGAPVCAPARCVLMTGKHTGHAYIRGNDEWRARGDVWDFAKAVDDPHLEGQRPLPANTQTVGKLLQGVGYTTGIVGKWGLGAPLSDGIPNKQGFDFFYGYNCQRQAHTYYPKYLWKNSEKVWLDNPLVVPGTKLDKGADPLDPASYAKFNLKEYSPDLMFKEIVNFVDENQKKPFFMYWATTIPHVALQAPKRWVDYYVKKFGDEKPYLGNKGYFPCRYPHATYAAMVSYLDEHIGLLVKQLKELGIYENTLIFFTSDNGPSYTGGADSEWFRSAAPFRSSADRCKGYVYEGGIREPMIAVWPGKIQPGSTSDFIGAFYDVLPTLCDVSNAPIPKDTDGISFLPTLLGKKQKKHHDFLYWEFPSYGGQQAVRMGNWKGIRRNILKGNLKIELYDLNNDISEEHDVAAEHPDIVKRIEQIMQREHVPPQLDRFKMKALGDI
ncbi:MAG: arylsulfatase [Calditrichaeota bacterium]|nr:arylsulfatase [Calditrichota bacterium]